jgi:glutamyl-tRNA synthetase
MYRFATSATRDLHINDLRIALFNYICAKQSKKNFIVRIEDTKKAEETKDLQTLDLLSIFGINYDYLYYQSENFKYHLQFASSLMDKGKAFACFCTEKELKNQKTYSGKCINISQQELLNNNLPFTIRIKKPTSIMELEDTVQGTLSFSNDAIDSFIIMNREKYPTSAFSSACDDMLQGISHIIDKEKNLLKRAREELVRKSLGYNEKILYTHFSDIVCDESNNVKYLLDQGFLPQAIINYLLTLGYQSPKEIFTLEEALTWFRLENVAPTKIEFDIEKLRYINKKHIKAMDELELSTLIGYSSVDIGKLAKIYISQASTTLEIKKKIDSVFSQKNSEKYEQELATLKAIIKNAPYLETFEKFQAYLQEQSGLSEKELAQPLRFLLTASSSGPKLDELYDFIKHYLQEIAR